MKLQYLFLYFTDSATTRTMKPRWLTLIGDGVLNEFPGRRSGYQVIIGNGFSVADFIKEIQDGSLKIKSERVALMIGTDMMDSKQYINLGNRLEKLVREIKIKEPDTQFWISSVLPRPDEDAGTDEMIKKVNGTVSTMCKKMWKYHDTYVKYVPMHCGFMEKWKHLDMKSGKMLVTTRIKSPWDRYFVRQYPKRLTEYGIQCALEVLEGYVRETAVVKMARVLDLPEMVVEVENVREEDDPILVLGEETAETQTGASGQTQNGAQSGQVKRRQRLEGPSKIKRSAVAKLIHRWETATTSLDEELGEDSVVPVSLGDGSPGGSDDDEVGSV